MKILGKEMPKRGWLLLLCSGVWLIGASALVLPINICSHRHVTYPASGGSLGSSGIVYFNTSDTKSYDGASFVNPCVTSFNVEPKCAVHFHLVGSKFRGCYEAYKRQIINANSKVCDPRCTYLFAYDSDYFNASIKFYFIGDTWDYSAMSKQTILGFCRSVHDNSIGKVNFNMTFKVKEKIFTVDGTSQDTDSPGVIRSVNFPYGYTQHDDVYLYKIQSRNQDDFVRVTFDDWDLDAASTLEVDDGASSFYYGSSNRPILTSITNVLQFRFSTRSSYGTDTTSVRHMGFKLTYEFVPSQPDDDTSTDCGAYDLDSSGGVIEFTGPPRTHNPAAYDCVWVVKRQPQYNNLFLKLLKTTNYRSSSWTIPNRFEVYYGLTSDSQHYRSFPPGKTDDAKIGFKSTTGFYIRLKGSFFQEDSFKMAFASFDSLPAGSEQCTHGLFTCSNRRCIYEKLKCDGVDHCGDNSDETSCPSPTDWSPTGSPFSLSVSIIIPIVVAMFLVIVICLFVVFLRRCQQAQRRQNGRNNQVPSVSGRMARGRRTRRSQIRVTIQQEYEDAPPTYEEAIGTPPNLGYFNMAFMWSQPDIPQTGLVSPPPYAEVIGGPEEESGNSPHYPAENDPNRRLTASDSLRSSARRDRRQSQLQTRTDADHQQSNHPAQTPQAGDLHIVLRRNSNTPSSGNNSLEHSQHSVGRQPLHVPVEALYGSDAHRRNKVKDTTASPQISVTNDGNKDICEHGSSDNQQSANHVHAQAQEDSSQGAGMHLQTGQSSRTAVSRYQGDASSAATGNLRVAAPRPTGNQQEAAATTVTNPRDAASPTTGNPHTNKQRGGKAPRRRYHQRNPYPDARNSNDNNPYTQPHNSSILGFNPSSRSDNVPHADNTGHTPPSNAEAIPGHLSGPRLPPSRRGMRPCYSYADIPTAAESYRPQDPRRASSAGRLVSDECSAVGEADIGAIAEVPEDTLPTAVPTQTEDCNDGEEAYKQRLSQSSQQIRLFLQRTASEDEDMYV